MRRLTVASPATLEVVFEGDDELGVDVGDVQVTIDSDRTGEQIADGAADKETVDRATVYRFAVDPVDDVDLLHVTWKADTATLTSVHEVAGGWYAALRRLASMDGLDATPKETLREARQAGEDLVERFTRQAFVPRYRRDEIRVAGRSQTQPFGLRERASALQLSRTPVRDLLWIRIDDDDANLDDVEVTASGELRRPAGWPIDALVRVAYRVGHDHPPADLRDEWIRFVRFLVLEEHVDVSPRATGMDNEFGNISYSIADEHADRPTGLPRMDAALVRYRQPSQVIA